MVASGEGDDPWQASDGTCWLHFPAYGEWHGWEPGQDGLFVMTEEEFGRVYPERMQGHTG